METSQTDFKDNQLRECYTITGIHVFSCLTLFLNFVSIDNCCKQLGVDQFLLRLFSQDISMECYCIKVRIFQVVDEFFPKAISLKNCACLERLNKCIPLNKNWLLFFF